MPKREPALDTEQLPAYIESILFVAEEPASVPLLMQSLRITREAAEDALAELEQRCLQGGIRLQRDGDIVQLVTAPEAGPYVERFLGLESRQRLSGAALEALAIIAYRQPVTRAMVEQIRGVNSDGAIASLIARGLVEEVGKAPGPGRPGLLGTTMKFLEHFGLTKPTDLPPLASAEMAATLGLDFDEDDDAEDDDAEDEDTAIDEDQVLVDAVESTGAGPVIE
jgi:segregation and condensation protein B